jgi:hypothetical protein
MMTLAIRTGWFVAVMFIADFLLFFAYDLFFEVVASGRTPGKRVCNLRVVRSGGQPVGFLASLIRNALRLIDFLPSSYLLGGILIVATQQNQRLGDIAAGTLVVREGAAAATVGNWSSWSRPTVPLEAVADWDVSAVTPAEVAAARQFLDRRLTLPGDTRYRLSWELAQRVGSKVTGIPQGAHPEYVLEGIIVAKDHRQ